LNGHTPGHTGYEFSSNGQKILFWGDTIHVQIVQLRHPAITVVFDIDHAAAAAKRNQLLPTLASESVMIAGPHMPFPGLGRLRKEGTAISGRQWYSRSMALRSPIRATQNCISKEDGSSWFSHITNWTLN